VAEEAAGDGTLLVRPPSSIILVDGGPLATIPKSLGGKPVATTTSCVVIGTKAAPDGPTRIRLRTAEDETRLLGSIEAFRGVIETPSGVLYVRSAHDEVYLTLELGAPLAKLVVTVDDLPEPEAIEIEATGVSGDIAAR
jgi:hypothetical protein